MSRYAFKPHSKEWGFRQRRTTLKELTLNGSNTGFDGNCVFSLGSVTLQSMRLTSPVGGFNPARVYNAGSVTIKNQVIVE